MTLAATTLTIRRLCANEARAFRVLGEQSTLGSLRSERRRDQLLRQGVVLGAFVGETLIGCSCVLFDSPRAFHLRDGTGATLATPNCYLCSTFVRPESRGGGLGTSLYSRRLEFVNKLERSTVAIEIMGTGVPMQIESSAMVGFRFHVAAGFEIAGYSAEDDHGPLLICRH